ncbi:MAG TPA: NADH-quinone oxidoreductase subunit NuoG [Gammaproteobacteria bacterium]
MPIYVDDREYPAAPEKNLLEHCLSLGFDLPYFCWHPELGSVGACRQCAVKQYRDENDRQGRIVMACMTPAADGTRIGLDEAEARDFRARVIEWLMVNHPHDCPVCEEGGECHLQDMTVMTGHNYRRYRGLKRTFRNQYLGPFVNHEMNRCIACYRCVRFYQDYAGGDDLRAFASHHHVYFGRHEDGVLENEFSGNLAEVCPTGVFTDKPFGDRYVRKWDLQSAPSVCVHCSLGCNIIPQERYGRLRRIVNRYNGEVNRYFICDRGRFGYGFVNGDTRIRAPLARGPAGELEAVGIEDALERIAGALDGGAIGIGSPRASLEANFALRRLVGADRFHVGISETDRRLVAAAAAIYAEGGARPPSLREAGDADAVLVLGEDPTHTAPRLALTLRQAARNRQKEIAAQLRIPEWLDQPVRTAGLGQWSPLFIATPQATKLDAVAAGTYRDAPEGIARLGFAVAHRLDGAAPDAPDLPADPAGLADRIAAALGAAERPLVVSGTGARSTAVIEAAANVARALARRLGRAADLALMLPECNSAGLALLGGRGLGDALERIAAGEVRAAIVLENDLDRRMPRALAERFRAGLEHLVVIDHTLTPTAGRADVMLPAAAFAEGDGTLVSSEGRAQRFFQVFVPEGEIRESWRWLAELMRFRGERCAWHTLDDVTAECARSVPALERITAAAPNASFRTVGRRISREPARYSGRTAMHANVEIRERKPPPDPDAPLAFSMEGYYGPKMPPALIPYFWAPRWNSVQSVNKFQDEIGGSLRGGDPGVRLVEPQARAADGFFAGLPATEPPSDGSLRLVALHHIFGSDELSAASPPLAERIPPPYVALHPDEAGARRLAPGALAEVALPDTSLTLPVRIDSGLARGIAGLPAGLPGMPFVDAPTAVIRAAAGGAA